MVCTAAWLDPPVFLSLKNYGKDRLYKKRLSSEKVVIEKAVAVFM